jgi:hypothetical protein
MLALVAAAERFVARHEGLDFTTVWASGWRYAGRAAGRDGPGCEVLCLGDSLVKFGVLPSALQGRLGRKATNLALCVGQPPATLAVLRRALDAGARPKAVVVDFTEHLLSVGPRRNRRHWPELLDVAESLDLAHESRDADLVAELLLARLLPSYKDRYEVRAGALAALRGARTPDREMLPAHWRNWNRNGGAQPIAAMGPQPPIGDWFRAVYPRRWSCHPVNMVYLRRFLDLTGRRGIAVFWLLPPYTSECRAMCESNGVEARFLHFVRRLQAEYPHLVVLDGRLTDYPTPVFIDPIHLDRTGALAFSGDVADAVARRLDAPAAGPAWVDLPRFRPPSTRLAIEDLGQSAATLRR